VLLISVLIAYFDRMNISYALPKIARDYGWSVEEIGKTMFILGWITKY
jgi:hypothetical protein